MITYAFDPGKTTGWARLAGEEFRSGQLPLEQTLHWLFESLKQGIKLTIVCEDFIYTPETAKKSRQTWSTEGIGALRFLAREFECDFILQSPSSAKSFASDEKLKRIDWWNPGQVHANDAARHLLLWAVENGRINIRRFLDANN